jgi:hypothetical protein
MTRNQIITGILAIFWGMEVFGGDLSTDNLTVNDKATFRGSVEAGGVSVSSPTNGLMLFFNFTTNTTPVEDLSGNNNTGTVSGATWTASGMTNGAYSYDGSDDRITVADSETIDPSDEITISAWIKMNSDNPGKSILGKHIDDSTRGYFAQINYYTTSLNFYVSVNNTHQGVLSTYVMTTGVWHMVTGTYDGSHVRVYIDGSEKDSTELSGTMDNNSEPLSVGCLSANGATQDFFDGLIDEVRVYNRALSADEIKGLYYYYSPSSQPTNTVRFSNGVNYVYPLGDVGMGTYTTGP